MGPLARNGLQYFVIPQKILWKHIQSIHNIIQYYKVGLKNHAPELSCEIRAGLEMVHINFFCNKVILRWISDPVMPLISIDATSLNPDKWHTIYLFDCPTSPLLLKLLLANRKRYKVDLITIFSACMSHHFEVVWTAFRHCKTCKSLKYWWSCLFSEECKH